MKIGVAISYYDEGPIVARSLLALQPLDFFSVVRSGDEQDPAVEEALATLGKPYMLAKLPNLGGEYSRFELPARAMVRNYAHLADSMLHWTEAEGGDLDYVAFATGDTLFTNSIGVEDVCRRMAAVKAVLGAAVADGQDFHSADLTLEELEAGKGGGRVQSVNRMDFMPQFFVVARGGLLAVLRAQVTNRWTTEQCLGDAFVADGFGVGNRYLFARTAYGYGDGVVYQTRVG